MKKPNLLLTIFKDEQFNLSADGYIIGYEKFSAFGAKRFSYEEIASLSKDKNLFVLMNSIIHEDNLQEFKSEVDKLGKLNIGIITQDLGGLRYILTVFPFERVIYNPYTLICNQDDLITYEVQKHLHHII